MSKRFRWVFAIVCALGALLSCFAYGESVKEAAEMDRQEAIARYGGEVTSIVVAAKDLEPGDTIDALSCELRDWVVDLVPEGAISTLDEVRGATLTSPVSQGTPLTQVALRDSSDVLDIPAGKVALSVSVGDKTGVTASVRAGTLLNAYRVIDGQTRPLSSDVVVISQTNQESDDQITLAVPAKDVAALMQATSDGSLRLVQPASDLAETQPDTAAPTDAWGSSDGDEASQVDGVGSEPLDGEAAQGEDPSESAGANGVGEETSPVSATLEEDSEAAL